MEFLLDPIDPKIIISLLLIFVFSIIYFLMSKSAHLTKSTIIDFTSEINMNNISSELNIKYKLIETVDDIKELASEILINNISRIGLDTEYFKGSHYQGHLCLFQISYFLNSEKKISIIDLLKFEKKAIINNLEKILNNERIEKVIHACENDIEWIYEDYGIFVRNVFDTQEIFTIINENNKKVGLNHLLNNYFKLNLEKQTKKYFQTSNWEQRPLLKEQLDYAALDTLYLVDLRDKIYDEFKQKMITLKKKKKKKLLESANNTIADKLSLKDKIDISYDEDFEKNFILREFSEIHKTTEFDKYLI